MKEGQEPAFPCEVMQTIKELVTITDHEATAFGEQVEQTRTKLVRMPGLTIRDYFAAKALQGMCACPIGGASCNPTKWDHDEMAKAAYMQAYAMLKARGEK